MIQSEPTVSVTSFDGHCVRLDFETREEADAFAEHFIATRTDSPASDVVERVKSTGKRHMDAVAAVFAIDPATKDNYASGSPTKSQAVYDRFVELDAAGKAHGAALAALASNPIASDSIEPVPVVCASCGFPWGMDPVRHAEMCDNRQALATPEGEKP